MVSKMELKVWVDGIQRVVCGINEQTTVQEVVIALAQATGRTGRYTLVEQWKGNEKMLPPSERPLQVLSNFGKNATDVAFVLRRTGASSVSTQGDDEGVVLPERTTYRQSLPPQMKHRQKNEAILNRKEPKRKSLTITGSSNSTDHRTKMADASFKFTDVGKMKQGFDAVSTNNNNNTAPKKKALIPPPLRLGHLPKVDASLTPPSGPVKGVDVTQTPPRSNSRPDLSISAKKKALIPPAFRKDDTPTPHTPPKMHPGQRTSTSSNSSLPGALGKPRKWSETKTVPVPINSPPPVKIRTPDVEKARSDFTNLVLEQSGHLREQNSTLNSLTEELEKFHETLERKDKNSVQIKLETEELERRIERNEADLFSEKLLQGLLEEEEHKGMLLRTQSDNYQSEISSMNSSIREMEEKLKNLNQELQQARNEKSMKTKSAAAVFRNKEMNSNIHQINGDLRKIAVELKKVQTGLRNTEEANDMKMMQLETLNRELRQVNLQQFIRQTGSKVTVLPSDTEKGGNSTDLNDFPPPPPEFLSSPTSPPPNLPPGEAGGVWV